MVRAGDKWAWVAGLLLGAVAVSGARPQSGAAPYDTSGAVVRAGRTVPYLIRRLPVSSFPQLPSAVQQQLGRRGCLIPQTYQAHGPENVVQGSFERPGSHDWAVLCSAGGSTSLLVFFGSGAGQQAPGTPFVLATAPETERLQRNIVTGALGFDWAIDDATPQQVHDAQAGLDPRPPMLDHDAISDSTLDRRTVYHFYAKDSWMLVDMPVE